jgi:hypothetical protein
MVNREHVTWHLSEARAAIDGILEELASSRDYDESEFWVDMQHAYHHLNTAWNARNATVDQVARAGDAEFNRWSALPTDLPMMTVGDSGSPQDQ